MKCAFFGHRTVTENIGPALRAVLADLIEKRGADEFFVGNNGAFDSIVLS